MRALYKILRTQIKIIIGNVPRKYRAELRNEFDTRTKIIMPWVGFVKPIYIMDEQTIINAIVALNGTLSALNVIGDKGSAKKVSEKIIMLMEQLA